MSNDAALIMEVRPYAPGDEAAILSLFEASFGQSMDAAAWRWRFMENPAARNDPVIDLMWDGDVLAGHYAVSPSVVSIDGNLRRAALSMTTMVHPNYRGRGIFTTLAESVYARMVGAGYALVYGFPNEASHFGFVHQLGWRDVYEIPLMAREATKDATDQIAVDRVTSFTDDHAALFSSELSTFKVHVRRDASYLNWRYFGCPDRTYYAFACRKPAAGLAVCKIYSADTGNQCDTVEFIATDRAATEGLLAALHRFANEHRATRLNIWMNRSARVFPALERARFQHTAPVTWFGYRALADALLQEILAKYDDWYLSMGDSDVY